MNVEVPHAIMVDPAVIRLTITPVNVFRDMKGPAAHTVQFLQLQYFLINTWYIDIVNTGTTVCRS